METRERAPEDQAGRIVDGIAHRLRDVRRRLNIGQAEVAESTGASLSTYKGYEGGQRVPTVAYLVRLALELGTDPAWLLIGDGSSTDKARATLVETVAMTVARNAATMGGEPVDPERIAKMARYAYEASVAKGSDFGAEFQQVLALSG